MAHTTYSPLGFACPDCQTRTPTEWRQVVAVGQVVRTRRCPGCIARVLTVEQAVKGRSLLAARPGFYCATHDDVWMDVDLVRRAAAGVVVRYRQCRECRATRAVEGGRAVTVAPGVRTEERPHTPALHITVSVTVCTTFLPAPVGRRDNW